MRTQAVVLRVLKFLCRRCHQPSRGVHIYSRTGEGGVEGSYFAGVSINRRGTLAFGIQLRLAIYTVLVVAFSSGDTLLRSMRCHRSRVLRLPCSVIRLSVICLLPSSIGSI
jgi:hypothetical protein